MRVAHFLPVVTWRRDRWSDDQKRAADAAGAADVGSVWMGLADAALLFGRAHALRYTCVRGALHSHIHVLLCCDCVVRSRMCSSSSICSIYSICSSTRRSFVMFVVCRTAVLVLVRVRCVNCSILSWCFCVVYDVVCAALRAISVAPCRRSAQSSTLRCSGSTFLQRPPLQRSLSDR